MTATIVEQMNIDTEDSSSPIDNQFSAILNTLSQFKTQITAISTQMKTLEKTVKREIKQHKKEVIKKQSKGNRKPSGFAAASPISEELCDFMGKERGTSIARTEVTKFICSYIDENSLRNAENKRVINPDDKLKSLLDPDADTVLTYFNIQRFMNKHFIKKTVVESSK
jgi:chromatin remodeling complex protein RSC6